MKGPVWTWTDYEWQKPWVYIQILGDVTFWELKNDFQTIKHWLMLDNSMHMYEILSGTYELAMTAIVIINMQEQVFYTYY